MPLNFPPMPVLSYDWDQASRHTESGDGLRDVFMLSKSSQQDYFSDGASDAHSSSNGPITTTTWTLQPWLHDVVHIIDEDPSDEDDDQPREVAPFSGLHGASVAHLYSTSTSLSDPEVEARRNLILSSESASVGAASATHCKNFQ